MSLLRHHNLLIGQFHPFYQAVLNKAIAAGYALPSFPCMVLQDRLVRNLVSNGLWSSVLDYLHVYTDDSGSADMSRINWIQITLALSTGTPTHVPKKGLYGTINHSFTAPTNYVVLGAGSSYASQFVWLTENGGTISSVENLVAINSENAGSARQQTIRLRTNPRVDYLLNTTTAGVAVVYNGFPVDNHFYMIDVGSVASEVHSSSWVNGVATNDNFPVGTGVLPDAGTLKTLNVTSTRAVGLIGGGGSIYNVGKQVTIYNIIKEYMTAVQAL